MVSNSSSKHTTTGNTTTTTAATPSNSSGGAMTPSPVTTTAAATVAASTSASPSNMTTTSPSPVAAAAVTGTTTGGGLFLHQQQLLEVRYPVYSDWELTLLSSEIVVGQIYTTDEISQTIVVQTPLPHTTLACTIRLIHVLSIAQAIRRDSTNNTTSTVPQEGGTTNTTDTVTTGVSGRTPTATSASSSSSNISIGTPPNDRREMGTSVSSVTPSSTAVSFPPLAKIHKKVLEEREKKAIRLAEESLRHINQKASPEGQIIFDRLLKACSEAVWKDESILVLNHIQVDPPYGPDQCRIVSRTLNGKKALEDGSLDRVKKIVAASMPMSSPPMTSTATMATTTTTAPTSAATNSSSTKTTS